MRLSTRAQYAVRAMVDLSLHSGDGRPVALRDIARRENISLSYLEQLFNRLKNGGIVASVRGPGGGYLLARQRSLINVGEIVAMVEEPLVPVSCQDERGGGCTKMSPCVTHNVWTALGERIRGFLTSITLEDLASEAGRAPER